MFWGTLSVKLGSVVKQGHVHVWHRLVSGLPSAVLCICYRSVRLDCRVFSLHKDELECARHTHRAEAIAAQRLCVPHEWLPSQTSKAQESGVAVQELQLSSYHHCEGLALCHECHYQCSYTRVLHGCCDYPAKSIHIPTLDPHCLSTSQSLSPVGPTFHAR